MKENNELERYDIVINRDMEVDCGTDKTVTAYVETWFDVDKKFGISTAQDDNIWVNMYAVYHTETGNLQIKIVISKPNDDELLDYIPAENEKDLIVGMMEEQCQLNCGCSMKEFVNQFCSEEQEMGGL